jgi:uncharacterized UPF0160 family protein
MSVQCYMFCYFIYFKFYTLVYFIFILQTDPSGEIIVFPNGGCPWRDHLSDIEQEQNLSPNIKYVIYSDNNGHWRVQCVPARIGSFENR